MNRPQVILFSTLSGVLILVAVFVLLYPRFMHPADAPVDSVSTTVPVTHQFKKGVHTYVGEIKLPTPCFNITGQAIVKESYPEQVDVRLETRESGDICAQVITTKKFKVSFEASEEAVLRAYLNGTPVLFQVTEASPSIDLQATQI